MSEPVHLRDRVEAALRGPCGVDRGDTLLVALSGGLDSTALLDVLVRLRDRLDLSVRSATVDHGLRPGSRAEAQAAGAVCDAVGVGWRRLRVSIPEQAVRREGPEAAARGIRLRALEDEADRIGADAIALAHHRDDQAETVLMRALVGAGTRGLAGIRPRSGRRIRPLLGIRRADLERYARRRGLRWSADPSNGDRRYLRNRIRGSVLPAAVEAAGISVPEQLARLAERAAVDEELLGALAG